MEINDFTNYLGIEAEDMDTFKAKFKEKYFTVEEVHADRNRLNQVIGKTMGSMEDATLKLAKAHGVEIKKEDIKGKKIEEVFETVLSTREQTFKAQIDAEKQKALEGTDEKFKALNDSYEQSVMKNKDLEKLLDSTSKRFEKAEKEWNGKIKSVKKDSYVQNLISGVEYSPDLDPYKKKGFVSELKEKFVFDFDENDDPFVTDTNGNRIEDASKHGAFKTPKQVLDEFAKEAGVTSKNKDAGRVVKPVQPANGQVPNPQPAPVTRRIHPSAQVS